MSRSPTQQPLPPKERWKAAAHSQKRMYSPFFRKIPSAEMPEMSFRNKEMRWGIPVFSALHSEDSDNMSFPSL